MVRVLTFLVLAFYMALPGVTEAAKKSPAALPQELVLKEAGTTAGTGKGSVFFVGNATVILKIGPFTILTDPNFVHKGEHVHLGYGLKGKRLTDPAMEIEALPHIDFLLVSHFHGDHFDQAAEQKLDKNKPIITAEDAVDELNDKGFRNVRGLDTWEEIVVRKGEESLKITAMPAKHAPLLMQPMMPDVIGSMIEYQTPDEKKGVRIYISGDTLMHDALEEIPERFPAVDLGLIHLGGTRILGVLLTMDAKQGAAALKAIRPETAIPVHYNDYDVFKSGLEDFRKEIRESGYKNSIVYLEPGETYEFSLKEITS